MPERLWVTELRDRNGALSPDGWPELVHLVVGPPIAPKVGEWPDAVVTMCGMRVTRYTSLGYGFESHPDGKHPLADWAVHCGITAVPDA